MKPEALKTALDELKALDREALAERWQQAFGHPAPPKARSPLLLGALAWHLQMKAHGRLRSGVPAPRASTQAVSLLAGTRLLREWQGQTHQVLVLADGFEHAGIRYRSLSAIARHITGTAWSGPLFFGLRT